MVLLGLSWLSGSRSLCASASGLVPQPQTVGRSAVLCFVVGAAFTGWSFWFKGVPGVRIETPMLEWAWEFCTPNVLLATFGVFVMATCIGRSSQLSGEGVVGKTSGKCCCNCCDNLITDISKCSFGMYLMHMFYLAPIAKFFVAGNPAEPLLPIWATIPCIAVLTYICCYVTTKLLSYIPGSKYFIG